MINEKFSFPNYETQRYNAIVCFCANKIIDKLSSLYVKNSLEEEQLILESFFWSYNAIKELDALFNINREKLNTYDTIFWKKIDYIIKEGHSYDYSINIKKLATQRKKLYETQLKKNDIKARFAKQIYGESKIEELMKEPGNKSTFIFGDLLYLSKLKHSLPVNQDYQMITSYEDSFRDNFLIIGKEILFDCSILLKQAKKELMSVISLNQK